MEMSNKEKTINYGIGFPSSLSINECAAHYHPLSESNTILKKNDIIKVDFGVETNGWIIDSAMTLYFNPRYDNLAHAVKEATEYGIKNIGIDVDIGDWGESIQEVMESYEIELDGKTYKIKSIENLGGHNITKNIIHGGMFLPISNVRSYLPKNYRFTEGVYAVETFGSTGLKSTTEIGEPTLYRIVPNNNNIIKLNNVKKLFNKIKSSFNTLPFTDRYVELFNIKNYKTFLKFLSNNNYLYSYPPLCVNQNAYTAQYEHTLYINEYKKYVFSNYDDY
jgi:methionyl aminopeptidase